MQAIRLAAAAAALGLALAARAQDLYEGYTCCNLHYDKDWISDANWRQLPSIPAGAKIRITSYGWNNRAYAEIDGREMRIGHDYGRGEEKLEQYVAKLVVQKDPRIAIARYPAKVRDAVKAGTVIPGMTREQVLVSVGYPPTHRTPSLDSRVWNLWASRAGRYEVHFNDKGVVEKVVGSP